MGKAFTKRISNLLVFIKMKNRQATAVKNRLGVFDERSRNAAVDNSRFLGFNPQLGFRLCVYASAEKQYGGFAGLHSESKDEQFVPTISHRFIPK